MHLQINKSMCVDKSTERFELRPPVRIGIKLAGVHWGYRTPSHAAEMTAGYYNTMHRDGYAPFFKLLSDYNGGISFTCVEMRDCEHPPESACSPEDLLRQILHNSKLYGVLLLTVHTVANHCKHFALCMSVYAVGLGSVNTILKYC